MLNPFAYYLVVMIVAIFIATVFYNKQNYIVKRNYDLIPRSYDILILRDTVINDGFNASLGKIVSNDLKNKLVLVRTEAVDEFKMGDVIRVNTSLKENKSKANYFDAMFFGKVHYQINFVEVEKVGKIEFNLFLKFISWLRGAIDINIKEIVGVKNHNLVSMWILGKTKVNDTELNNLFKSLGISHILVISGTHLSILFNLVSYMVIFLIGNYWLGIALLFLFLCVFLFLTGASSSILRATLFWVVIMIGRIYGKIINYTNVLLLVILIFFVINPNIVVFDLGFHLSFLSIVALIYILPIISFFIKSDNTKFNFILSVFNSTLAVTILLFPYLVYFFSNFNVLSVLFNIILIPFSGAILSLAFASLVVSFGSIFFAKILGYFVYLLINVFLFVLNMFNTINLRVGGVLFESVYFIISFYAILIILVIDFYIKNKKLTLNL